MPHEIQIYDDAIYDVASVPKLTGVSPDVVKRAKLDGTLPATKRGGRWFCKGSSILAWLVDQSSEVSNANPH